jgi:hypothetical protein
MTRRLANDSTRSFISQIATALQQANLTGRRDLLYREYRAAKYPVPSTGKRQPRVTKAALTPRLSRPLLLATLAHGDLFLLPARSSIGPPLKAQQLSGRRQRKLGARSILISPTATFTLPPDSRDRVEESRAGQLSNPRGRAVIRLAQFLPEAFVSVATGHSTFTEILFNTDDKSGKTMSVAMIRIAPFFVLKLVCAREGLRGA